MENPSKLKAIRFPLAVLGVFVFFVLLYILLDLPSKSEIISKAQEYYGRYGYWTVLFGSMIEGMLLVNWYFPGSVIAVLGVVFAKENNLNVYYIVSLIILGFFSTSLINYAIGRFGWYRLLLKLGLERPLENIKSKVEKKGLPIIFTTFFHPNLSALVATSAGILRLDFKKFFVYSLLATAIWNSIWGLVVYHFGSFILDVMGLWFLGLVLVGWVGYSIYSVKKAP